MNKFDKVYKLVMEGIDDMNENAKDEYIGFRVELNICHDPLTWREVRTWDIESHFFKTPEEVTEYVQNLFKSYYSGASYIRIYCIKEDGTEVPFNGAGISYKQWNGFKFFYENGKLVFNSKCWV